MDFDGGGVDAAVNLGCPWCVSENVLATYADTEEGWLFICRDCDRPFYATDAEIADAL